MNQIAKTDPRLKPATPGEITEHLHQLFASLPQKGGDDPVAVLKGYTIAINGYPEWAVGKVVHAFIRGTVPGQSKQFCPRAPELSAAIRKELEPIYSELSNDREKAKSREEVVNFRKMSAPTVKITPKGEIIDMNVDHGTWLDRSRRRAYPDGAIWVAKTATVHAPAKPITSKPPVDDEKIPW